MGGSIPKEKNTLRYVVVTFPSLEEKCYILQEKKNTLMVLNVDHQRYKITYGYRISLLPLP